MSANPGTPTLLIAAGGTGGHIMPGLAVAQEMRARGWEVAWLGNPARMEGRLVPAQDINLLPLHFAGLRGRGALAWVSLPWRLFSACRQAGRAIAGLKPDVVLGMGGYVAFPAGLMARRRRIPLVIHEQNAIAGTANRVLARLADRVMTGFPGSLTGGVVVGNPVRAALAALPAPQQRYAGRTGPLRLLVIGGSQGAAVLNTVLPEALARIPAAQRPEVWHQSGEQHLAGLQAAYARAGVQAQAIAFIDDMAGAMAWADLIVCRAGAMAVAEVAAAGVAALFVPLPHAIDDHQTANARFLSDCEAAWMQPQAGFTADWLADWLLARDRDSLLQVADHARQHARPLAAQAIADACEQSGGRAA